MARRLVFAGACLITLLAATRPVEAQWSLTPSVGVTARASTGYFDPDDAVARRKIVFGLALSRTWRRFGVELDVAQVPDFFSGRDDNAIITSSRVRTITGNLVVHLPRTGPLRPYAVAGLGGVHVTARDVAEVFPVSEWLLMFDAGAGVMVPAGRRMSFGADARYFRSRRGDGTASSIGFGETFADFWRLSARMTIALSER
jgi:opacity protein-like surface antigen